MSKWGNIIARARDIDPGLEERREKRRLAGLREVERMRKADQERGHIWESKMKRRD